MRHPYVQPFNLNDYEPTSPFKSNVVGVKIEVQPLGTLDGTPSIFNYAPPITGHVHSSSKSKVVSVGSDGAVMGEEEPGEKDDAQRNHPGMNNGIGREEARLRFMGVGAAGSAAGVLFAFARAR